MLERRACEATRETHDRSGRNMSFELAMARVAVRAKAKRIGWAVISDDGFDFSNDR